MKTPSNFKCKRCGSCCLISPFLTDEDADRIKRQGYDEKHFLVELKGKKFMKILGGKCVFLDNSRKTASCKIYSSRPKICREYPAEIRDDGDCRPEVLKFDMKKRF